MRNKIKKFIDDPKAYIFLNISGIRSTIYINICSIYTSILAWLKGVNLKGKIECYGIPYLMRYPSSQIIIGKDVKINSSFKSNNIGMLSRSRITTNTKRAIIEINSHVGMSAITISAFNKITIGSDTLIGGNVLITDSDWHSITPIYRFSDEKHVKTAPVSIGKNVFIGTRTIILKGSVIGDNSVIGAGSVVCGTIPPNVIAGGNPCVVIKKI
ncbi:MULTISPECIES: acyltransferase [unclassified Bacteroides]|uniref:acyltransferase n=1 Tax=unclassified Bacteroides TaxID=2646097 RepID=UPI0025C57C90|nr:MULTISPECIES: acyltransferase [unclassified Bacteroides]